METVVATVTELFRGVHEQMRDEVRGLDAEALNWTPAPETNSVAVLVTHTVGSEAEVLRIVRGLPSDRDRPAEFRGRAVSPDDLVARLDAADALLDELAPGISADDLAATRARPNLGTRTGLYWLLHNAGHAREHLAHIQLTKQVYNAQKAGRGQTGETD